MFVSADLRDHHLWQFRTPIETILGQVGQWIDHHQRSSYWHDSIQSARYELGHVSTRL